MPSYQVRPAVAGDTDTVAAIHASSSHAAYEHLVPGQHASLPMDKRRAFWRSNLTLDGWLTVGVGCAFFCPLRN